MPATFRARAEGNSASVIIPDWFAPWLSGVAYALGGALVTFSFLFPPTSVRGEARDFQHSAGSWAMLYVATLAGALLARTTHWEPDEALLLLTPMRARDLWRRVLRRRAAMLVAMFLIGPIAGCAFAARLDPAFGILQPDAWVALGLGASLLLLLVAPLFELLNGHRWTWGILPLRVLPWASCRWLGGWGMLSCVVLLLLPFSRAVAEATDRLTLWAVDGGPFAAAAYALLLPGLAIVRLAEVPGAHDHLVAASLAVTLACVALAVAIVRSYARCDKFLESRQRDEMDGANWRSGNSAIEEWRFFVASVAERTYWPREVAPTASDSDESAQIDDAHARPQLPYRTDLTPEEQWWRHGFHWCGERLGFARAAWAFLAVGGLAASLFAHFINPGAHSILTLPADMIVGGSFALGISYLYAGVLSWFVFGPSCAILPLRWSVASINASRRGRAVALCLDAAIALTVATFANADLSVALVAFAFLIGVRVLVRTLLLFSLTNVKPWIRFAVGGFMVCLLIVFVWIEKALRSDAATKWGPHPSPATVGQLAAIAGLLLVPLCVVAVLTYPRVARWGAILHMNKQSQRTRWGRLAA